MHGPNPPVVIGMEACGGAHDWARRFRAHGHIVTWMAPQCVKPYLQSNTHEMADAEAMGAAVTRPAILRRRLGYEPARGERTAQAKALQASIHHGEIEISNLSSKMDHDPELRDLDRQLVFEVDMSKGSLQQQTTMVR